MTCLAAYLPCCAVPCCFLSMRVVMASVKDVFLEHLAPEHHDQWEYAAQQCFQVQQQSTATTTSAASTSFTTPAATSEGCAGEGVNAQSMSSTSAVGVTVKTLERRLARVTSKYAEVLRRVACMYLTLQRDGAARELRLEVCSLVATSASVEEFMKVLKAQYDEQKAAETALSPPTLSAGSSSSGAASSTTVACKATTPADSAKLMPRGFFQDAKEATVSGRASAVRRHSQDCESRCKAYDANSTVSTAIRVVEQQAGGSLLDDSPSKKRKRPPLKKSATTSSIDDRIIKCRLGYRSAKAFCDELDIMQKIIKAYRQSEQDSDKDFLLRLICGSFTREEANNCILPPEAHVLRPGKVRNMKLISMHKWTEIRKAGKVIYSCFILVFSTSRLLQPASLICTYPTLPSYASSLATVGCPRLKPTLDAALYARGIRKRKRNMEAAAAALSSNNDSTDDNNKNNNNINMSIIENSEVDKILEDITPIAGADVLV